MSDEGEDRLVRYARDLTQRVEELREKVRLHVEWGKDSVLSRHRESEGKQIKYYFRRFRQGVRDLQLFYEFFPEIKQRVCTNDYFEQIELEIKGWATIKDSCICPLNL